MEFKSTIIQRIKYVKFYYGAVLVFYVIYNTIYGWNWIPENQTEKTLDKVVSFLIAFGLGWIISIILDFMKFMVNVQMNNLRREIRKNDNTKNS